MTTKVPVELFDAGAGFTIGSGAAEDTKIVFDGNAQDYYIGLDDSADDLIIGKGSAVGTTPAITIDSSQRVLIGATTDSYNAEADNLIIYDSGNAGLTIATGSTSGNNTIHFADGTSGDAQYRGVLEYEHNDDSMRFKVNGEQEAMRIASNGKILMKLTSAITDETLQIRTNQAIGYGILVDETASAGGTFMRFRVNGNVVGQIYGNGSATTYATSSDYRLKENITYDWDATTRLKNLKPARFNFKTDSSTTVDGFLAHEVSSVVPEAIGGEKDAVDSEGEPIYQSIDHSKLVPLLVKTILELEARITTLEGG